MERMTEPDVEAAIERVKGGRVSAYEVVVNAYQGRLRALLASVCPPGVDTDELAHTAFVEAFKKIDSYTAGTSFFAWLAAIGRNLALVELRRLRNQSRKHDGYLRELVSGTIEAEVEAATELDESRVRLLRGCMDALPPGTRSIVDMRYTEEAALDTIAGRVGKTVAAVKFQLFDIRRKLRDCVNRKHALQKVE
jgi:RNA polymerase sigma-70 factor (ECF subfamily)